MQSSNRLWNAVQGKLISFGQDLVSSGEAVVVAVGTGNSRREKCQEGKKTPPNHFVQVIQCKW